VKFLLTGHTGQLGWELARALAGAGEVVATDRDALDLSDADAIRSVVREVKPAVIVNSAAYTAVDRAESDWGDALQVNGVAPGILAEEAKRAGALLVHYSTDYVFDGFRNAPYLEGDAPNPVNAYGRSKLEGEGRVLSSGCRCLLLRTSWLYGPRGSNFFLAMARKAVAAEPLRVVNDQHGVPTESKFVAEMTMALLQRPEEGTFHVVPSGKTTWHGFALAIVDALRSKSAVTAISSGEYPTPARRPLYSILDNGKLSRTLGSAPPPWQLLLDRCIKAWKPA
jgi:dTDP-4-dehydrorhamnose reductase